MIDIEYLYFAVTMMATLGYYLSHRHGIQEYDNGFIDAVQLHSEGRLAYTMENIGEHENVLTIEVFEDES